MLGGPGESSALERLALTLKNEWNVPRRRRAFLGSEMIMGAEPCVRSREMRVATQGDRGTEMGSRAFGSPACQAEGGQWVPRRLHG